MKDLKAALMAMKALRRHANMMKLKGGSGEKMKDEEMALDSEAAEPTHPDDEAMAGGHAPSEDDEFFEPYKPYEAKPVSEKMTLVIADSSPKKERSPMAKAVDAVEGKPKRGPGRPRKN